MSKQKLFRAPLYTAWFIGPDGWERLIGLNCAGCLRKLVLAAEKLGRIRMTRLDSEGERVWRVMEIKRIVAHYGKHSDTMADPTQYLVIDCRPNFNQL